MDTSKKVAFITGANRGIGFETARELGQKGIKVIIGSRDKTKGDEAVEKLRAKDVDATAVVFDVNNISDHQKVYDYIDKNFGKLDILVNNAGIFIDNSSAGLQGNKTSSTSMDIVRKTFDSNFFGVIELTQKLLPLVRKAPEGRIVNLSSILSSLTLHSQPGSPIYESKAFAYNASKTALNAFTVHLAHELKDTKIKVNSAHPGWVKTELGGSAAPMEVKDGGHTSVQLATLGADGPTGGLFHLGEKIPW